MSERESARKIAFVGTMSTGKTTIFDHYRQKFSGDPTVVFVEEAARRYFKDNPEIVDRFAKEPQGEIQQWALSDEQKAHSSGARIIISVAPAHYGFATAASSSATIGVNGRSYYPQQ